ncbi:MAG: ferrous iron transporter B [Clostridia bacterium]|nr:ferrous iron transporter B [Clostridia bacterium]
MHTTPISGKIILAGAPNVGKSTLFNLLTGKKVHTGNWSGKTVSVSEGYGVHNSKKYIFMDLPGISSLTNPDAEEKSAFDSIMEGNYDCVVIVADSTNLTKSISLTLRICELTPKCILFLNMCDEAEKQGIKINSDALRFILNIPVICGSAHTKDCLVPLMSTVDNITDGNFSSDVFTPLYPPDIENALSDFSYDRKETILHIFSSMSYLPLKSRMSQHVALLSGKIEKVVTTYSAKKGISPLDKIFSSPFFGIPAMLLLLALVLYITIVLSNYPSEALSALFFKGDKLLTHLFTLLKISPFISDVLIKGGYSTTSTVVAVMLPPMAIFFPLFALLEDSGILPRIAFNADGTFKKCGGCGKQALTVCMGLGCNCVGVTNSVIIPSERERLISILTNSFTPCNGRFGAIIACISVFLAPDKPLFASLVMVGVLIFSFLTTFLSSFLLSHTVLKGKPSPFILELPSYRKPRFFRTILSSLTEHTPQILFRAILISAPTGAVIYILNHFNLLLPVSSLLNPLGAFMGLDGIILLSFILSFPANETVFPLILMLYTQSGAMVDFSSYSALSSILYSNNWQVSTALSFIIFTLMHWPCSTALLSIKSETGSIKWTVVSFILPLLFGFAFCALSNLIFYLFSV